MIPEKFKERYMNIVDEPDEFFSILSQKRQKSFRVNTIKSNPSEVIERFEKYGIQIEQKKWDEYTFVAQKSVSNTLDHFMGYIYIQELASMLPVIAAKKEIMNAKIVLDACSAPGSKSTHACAIMQNNNTLIANDVDFQRIRALKFNLEKAGAINTIITNFDFRRFPQSVFDVIILDAPCSAEGIVRKNPESLKIWSKKRIERSANIQKQLILKAYDLLKEDGTLIYSTCTFAPEENEEILNHLKNKKENCFFENINMPGFKLAKNIDNWKGKNFDEIKGFRVWPHHNNTDGFFLAKIRKGKE